MRRSSSTCTGTGAQASAGTGTGTGSRDPRTWPPAEVAAPSEQLHPRQASKDKLLLFRVWSLNCDNGKQCITYLVTRQLEDHENMSCCHISEKLTKVQGPKPDGYIARSMGTPDI